MIQALGSDRGYDLLQALHSASCDIIHETGGTICYGHWVLRFVIYHTQDRGNDLLRALGSASCDITHDTGGTICYGLWVLRLVISCVISQDAERNARNKSYPCLVYDITRRRTQCL